MNLFSKILVIIFITIGSLSAIFLGAHIILSLGKMYQLAVITQFTQIQIFVFMFIISLVRYRYKKSKNHTYKEMMNESITCLFNTLLYYLLTWGTLSLVHYLFF